MSLREILFGLRDGQVIEPDLIGLVVIEGNFFDGSGDQE